MSLSPTQWLALWIIKGEPGMIPPHHMAELPAEALFRRNQFECHLDPHTLLRVTRLFKASGSSAHNYLVSLHIEHPGRRRNKTTKLREQYPAELVPEAVREALEKRTLPCARK